MHLHLKKVYKDSTGHRNGSCDCTADGRTICELRMAQILDERIEKTCKAHLMWISCAETFSGCFAGQYWASGEAIDQMEYWWLDSSYGDVTDTPFQNIKFPKFAIAYEKGDSQHQKVRQHLQGRIRPWIRELDRQNRRGFYAFARHPGPSTEKFRDFKLDDHIWVWKALNLIAEIGLGDELKKEQRIHGTRQPRQIPIDTLLWDYSPHVFRRQILRRFMAQNAVTRQTMLAVGRSLSADRFMLRDRDTIMFYERETPCCDTSYAIWKETILSQPSHADNEDAAWDSPLRWGLALLMASHGHQINSRTPEDMLKTARAVIVRSTSASGMLAGRLSSYTQEADLDGSGATEEPYWHTCFEMAYLLWEQHLIISASPSSPSSTVPTGAHRRLPQPALQPAFGSIREAERAYTMLEM